MPQRCLRPTGCPAWTATIAVAARASSSFSPASREIAAGAAACSDSSGDRRDRRRPVCAPSAAVRRPVEAQRATGSELARRTMHCARSVCSASALPDVQSRSRRSCASRRAANGSLARCRLVADQQEDTGLTGARATATEPASSQAESGRGHGHALGARGCLTPTSLQRPSIRDDTFTLSPSAE